MGTAVVVLWSVFLVVVVCGFFWGMAYAFIRYIDKLFG